MGAKFIRDGLMMINFHVLTWLGHPDIWYPDIWSNIILDVSMMVDFR